MGFKQALNREEISQIEEELAKRGLADEESAAPGESAAVHAASTRPVSKLTQDQINQLVVDHCDLGRRLAWSMLASWRVRIGQEEVVSAVGLALCDAANRFDPDRGVSFKTFLFYHLRGILLKEIARIIEDQKICQYFNHGGGEGVAAPEEVPIQQWSAPLIEFNDPERLIQRREIAARCWEACDKLDELEREVIIRSFIYDEPLIEIADSLGYCRCHISRVKSKALAVLNRQLAHLDPTADDRPLQRQVEVVRNAKAEKKNYTGGRGRRKRSLARAA